MCHKGQGKHFLEAVQMLTLNLQSSVGELGSVGACGVRAASTGVRLTVLSLTLLELCAEGRQSGRRGKNGWIKASIKRLDFIL